MEEIIRVKTLLLLNRAAEVKLMFSVEDDFIFVIIFNIYFI